MKAKGTTDFTPGGSIKQALEGSCVSACGAMLTNGAVSESDLLGQLGEWSDPQRLAEELNSRGLGSWEGGNSTTDDLSEFLSRGPGGIELKAYGTEAHMVVAEMTDSGVLIRDPGVGAYYVQPLATVDQYWTTRGIVSR